MNKKLKFYLILLVAACSLLTACGGTKLEVINDTSSSRSYRAIINGDQKESKTLRPKSTHKYIMGKKAIDYVIFIENSVLPPFSGSVPKGDTFKFRFSAIFGKSETVTEDSDFVVEFEFLDIDDENETTAEDVDTVEPEFLEIDDEKEIFQWKRF